MGRSSRILLIVAMAALVALGASSGREAVAQDGGWVKVYDVPAPNFGAVEMFDDARGVAAGAGGLFYTTDGGASWQEGSFDQAVALGGAFSTAAQISFADANHAWVAGFSGQMWRTTDGGRSWRKQQTNTLAHFNSVSAVGPDEAWAAAFGEGFSDVGPFEVPPSVLLHTTDGGATWQQAFRSSKYGVFNQVQFVDAQRGWLIATPCFPGQRVQDCNAFAGGAALLGTIDGGQSWREVSLPEDASRLQDMQWFSSGRGYLAAFDCTDNPSSICENAFFRSDDGGETWTEVVAPGDAGWLGWRFVSPDRGFASTSTCDPDGNCANTFVQTLDGGATWSVLGGGPFVFRSTFDATSTKLLVPVSEGERPGGITLIDLATGFETAAAVPGHEAFSDVTFATRDRGYAVNRSGLWVSDNGGASWRVGSTPIAAYEVSAPSRDVVWIAGADPSCAQYCVAVFRSIDGGRT
ncbi:MAG TPA: YCF48-related protein, partial [Dehalococcoidia bacterium]|nr:YCF48-related protein [Dehalococcoidia bacterium]